MRIFVKARAGAGEEKVEKLGSGEFVVSVKEPPEKGLANKAIVYVVARYFGVSQSSVRIVSGHSSRRKILDVPNVNMN